MGHRLLKMCAKNDTSSRENREFGSPWRVTDLVTLGSPLTYANLLFGEAVDSLKKNDQMATCPPYNWPGGLMGEKSNPLKVHFSNGAFGPTRWTNLYFPVKYGFLGDLVGGPLNELFGPGVLDIEVKASSALRSNSLLSHTSYWLDEPNMKYQKPEKTTYGIGTTPLKPKGGWSFGEGEANWSPETYSPTLGESPPLALAALLDVLDLDWNNTDWIPVTESVD